MAPHRPQQQPRESDREDDPDDNEDRLNQHHDGLLQCLAQIEPEGGQGHPDRYDRDEDRAVYQVYELVIELRLRPPDESSQGAAQQAVGQEGQNGEPQQDGRRLE